MASRPTPPVKLYYRIGEVADVVGVEPHVLRYWESEFGTIRPQKSPKGQRVYSRKDLEKLLKVKELLYGQGYTIAGAKKRLREMSGAAKNAESLAESNALVAPRDASSDGNETSLPSVRSSLEASGPAPSSSPNSSTTSSPSFVRPSSAEKAPLTQNTSLPQNGPAKRISSSAAEPSRAHFSLESFDSPKPEIAASARVSGASGDSASSIEVKRGGGFSFFVEGAEEVVRALDERSGSGIDARFERGAVTSRKNEAWETPSERFDWESDARETDRDGSRVNAKIPDLFAHDAETSRFVSPPSLFDIALSEAEDSDGDLVRSATRESSASKFHEDTKPSGSGTREASDVRAGGARESSRGFAASMKTELVELRERIASELAFLSPSTRRWEGR